MFQFPASPSTTLWIHAVVLESLPQVGCPIRISTDQWLFAPLRSFSQLITSFIGSWCLGIHPMLLLAWPFAKPPISWRFGRSCNWRLSVTFFQVLMSYFYDWFSSDCLLHVFEFSILKVTSYHFWYFSYPYFCLLFVSHSHVRQFVALHYIVFKVQWFRCRNFKFLTKLKFLGSLTQSVRLVEIMRFELMTPCLQGRCSPNWAIPPWVDNSISGLKWTRTTDLTLIRRAL